MDQEEKAAQERAKREAQRQKMRDDIAKRKEMVTEEKKR
jgi:hypothetical protein